MKLHILSAIKKYAKSNPNRFHMPGHAGSKSFSKLFKGADLDVTELSVIDNETAVCLAENDAKKIVGVPYLRFLTGGSTSGVLSMLLAVKDFGDKIVIERGSHKSVYAGCVLANVTPIIIPDYTGDDDAFINDLSNALSCDGVIGTMLTYPDYCGKVFDIERVNKTVKASDKLLLIDNAHGGHFRYIDSVTYAGEYADVWVDGLHKNFCTLNQGAILCANQVSLTENLDDALNKILTTSPSYPILASIEYGVKYFDKIKSNKLLALISKIDAIKNKIERLGITVEKTEPLKLCVNFGSIAPADAEKVLEKYKVYAEMVGENSILFMISSLTTKRQLNTLYRAIKKVVLTCERKENSVEARILPQKRYDYLLAKKMPYEWVLLSQSEGRIAGDNVGLFPPCKPLVIAGEVITSQIINNLSKPNVFGLKDGKIKVVKE